MDTLRTLDLIERELNEICKMIHEARCCIYTDRRMRSHPQGPNNEWSQILRLDIQAGNITQENLSHEQIVYNAQEKVEFAKIKLSMISRLLSGKEIE